MVKLIITWNDLDNLIIWGRTYENEINTKTGKSFEPDESKLMEKLIAKYKSKWNPK